MNFLKYGTPFGLMVLLAAVVACTPAPTVPAPTPTIISSATVGGQPAPLSPTVKIAVGDSQQANEAGLYIAQDRGYFAREGLDVSFVTTSIAEEIPALATGQMQSGF